MAMPLEGYEWVEVESFIADRTSGLHGGVHVRPAPGGPYSTDLRVECSKSLSDTDRYPVGTRFRIWAKLTDREGGGQFLYSSYRWKYDVVPRRT
jgi:hypothetical protein